MIQILHWANAYPVLTLILGLPVVLISKALSKALVSWLERREVRMYRAKAYRLGFGDEFDEEMARATAALPAYAHLQAAPTYARLRAGR